MSIKRLRSPEGNLFFSSWDPGQDPWGGQVKIVYSPGQGSFLWSCFPCRLRLPIHTTIKRILNFYNICLAQLSPNAWRCVICVLVIWQFYWHHLSLSEFRCLYTLFKSLKPDSGWLYFKARPGRNVIKGSPNNVKGWKRRFFFVSGDDWEFSSS